MEVLVVIILALLTLIILLQIGRISDLSRFFQGGDHFEGSNDRKYDDHNDNVHLDAVSDDYHASLQGDRYQTRFLTNYIISNDHKTIGRQFLIFSLFWVFVSLLIAGLFGLANGGNDISWLRSMFGFSIVLDGEGVGSIAPEFLHTITNSYGFVMVFFVLFAGLAGAFGNLLIPQQIGTRNMAYPVLNSLSFWLFFFAGLFMFITIFVNATPFFSSFSTYPAVADIPASAFDGETHMTMWLVSLFLFAFSLLLTSINFILTVLRKRTEGMSLWKMPLTVWGFFISAIMFLIPAIIFAVPLLLAMLDTGLGTHLCLTDAIAEDGPIKFQSIYWFIGTPEIYLILLPALGIVSEIIMTHVRKPMAGYSIVVYSMITIGVVALVSWLLHFVGGEANEGITTMLSYVAAVATLIIAVLWLITYFSGDTGFSTPIMYAFGFVMLLVGGVIASAISGNAEIHTTVGENQFMIKPFYTLLAAAGVFAIFAATHHWYPKMFGRFMNKTVATIHFWLTFIAVIILFTSYSSVVAGLLAFLQLIFIANFFYSIWGGKKLTSKNPWGGNTLEWTTPITPIRGNWTGKLPSVS